MCNSSTQLVSCIPKMKSRYAFMGLQTTGGKQTNKKTKVNAHNKTQLSGCKLMSHLLETSQIGQMPTWMVCLMCPHPQSHEQNYAK